MVFCSEVALEQVSVFWKIPYATCVASLLHLFVPVLIEMQTEVPAESHGLGWFGLVVWSWLSACKMVVHGGTE